MCELCKTHTAKKKKKKKTFELIETTIQKFEFGSIVMKEVYHSHQSCIF